MGQGTHENDWTDTEVKSRARTLIASSDFEAAYHTLKTACHPGNTDPECWFLFAGVCASLDRLEEVIEGCRHTVRLDPGHAQAWYNLGLACFRLERYEEAISAYRSSLNIEPGSSATLGNLAAAWLESGDPEQAIEYCCRATAIDPDSVAAINTQGIACRELGRYQDALDLFERGARIDPQNTDIHWNRALAYLKCGNFQRGWDEFEWRWQFKTAMQRSTPYPRWHGIKPVSPLLVYMEQGIGDQIMFSSCLPDLQAMGIHAIVECDPRLVPLYERSFPDICFHGGSWDERRAECQQPIQRQIPVGSLPRLFRRDRVSFPVHTGYLNADETLVAQRHAELAALGEGLKVGVSWRGGNDARTRTRRSMALSDWRELSVTGNTMLVDIQYGEHQEDLDQARGAGMAIYSIACVDAMKDLDGFAALLKALDLVITVDNSTLHLAGALGIETWGLLPYDSDWRWEAGSNSTPWYPAVRLFRQHECGDWEGVLAEISGCLSERSRV